MLDKSDALSTELWALVFLHSSPNQWRPDVDGLRQEDLEQYSNLHRLKLVCKKFKQVFQEHHDLLRVLVLRENIGAQALPGLLAWVLGHSDDISLLQSLFGGSCTDAALTSLIGKQQLKVVHLKSPSDSAVQLLSMCAFVTLCTLHDPDPRLSMDLDCLKSILTLEDLELSSGTFTHVHLTSHLAGLRLTRAHVRVDAIKAACGLQQLCIDRSEIHGLEDGICMLTSLRRLWCCHSVVHTSRAACKLSTSPRGQIDIYGLTALTQLDFLQLCTKRPAYPSLEPVYALQSLNDLDLVAAGSSINVTEGLSKLSRLTKLVIEPDCPVAMPVQGRLHVNLDVQWGHMRDLQILHVIGAELRTDDLMKLTELKDLRSVDFSGTLPANVLSATHVAGLAHQLGLKRPDVHFQMKLDGES